MKHPLSDSGYGVERLYNEAVPEMISGRTRAAFRDNAAGSTLAEIQRDWESEGFAPSNKGHQEQGQRRTLWRDYEDSVDWSQPEHVARAIRVFESVVWESSEENLARLRRLLAQDGWEIDADRNIRQVTSPLRDLSGMSSLRNAGGIKDAFQRVELLLEENPAGAVGASKELIEATAKTVLSELNEIVDPKADVPDLIARVQKRLGLHPSQVDQDAGAATASRKILGGVSAIAIGVNELRNKGGGSGHGQLHAPRLHARHARLALNAARTWCELVLETYADPHAPWHRRES